MSRLFLAVIYLYLRKELKLAYDKYKACWNRNSVHKIKSITLRNCSLVFINAMVVALNIFLMMCSIYLMNL